MLNYPNLNMTHTVQANQLRLGNLPLTFLKASIITLKSVGSTSSCKLHKNGKQRRKLEPLKNRQLGRAKIVWATK